jgi:hypothetical protein
MMCICNSEVVRITMVVVAMKPDCKISMLDNDCAYRHDKKSVSKSPI